MTTDHTGFKDPADHPMWREFTSAERTQLQEGSPVSVLTTSPMRTCLQAARASRR